MNITARGRALELGRVLQAVRVREAEPAARTTGGRAGPSQRVGLTIRLKKNC